MLLTKCTISGRSRPLASPSVHPAERFSSAPLHDTRVTGCTARSLHRGLSLSRGVNKRCRRYLPTRGQRKPQQQQQHDSSVPSAVTTTPPPVLRNVPADGRPGNRSGSRRFASPGGAGCFEPRRLEVINAELPSRLERSVRLLGSSSRERRKHSPGGISPREASGSAVINIRYSYNGGGPGESSHNGS
ncbi:hypothetical protein EYF80_049842 [Liparis tanakae]|uniref:Uncharacterized protein n=1 Tax=Liparis tanakae TaxID=230148 RepID=A0A4Z2FFN4_9TELE|nr:hypothetical protein EYF80_049842 [Liparis tanakae]